MSDDGSRYSGPPTTRYSYMKEFNVECPKCKAEALVTTDGTFKLNDGQLTCKNCMHAEKASARVRYKSIVKRYCDSCGKAFESIFPGNKEPAARITVPCPHCGTIQNYNPRVEAYRIGYDAQGLVADPVFNLPLWLQSEVRGDVFWAYNRQHLHDIKTYVKAKLRERQTLKFTTMAEKLPQFIKAAKNRATLIKMIERLERKSK